MGEQPIFSTRAHVFHIDPETKKRWLPSSSAAVSVSYFYDSTRNAYRIISVEGSKAIINSTVTPTMTFTKTSQKFGQWSDPRANTIYGLGFSSERDLSAFVDKFKEIKELTRDGAPPPPSTMQQQQQQLNSTAMAAVLDATIPTAPHNLTQNFLSGSSYPAHPGANTTIAASGANTSMMPSNTNGQEANSVPASAPPPSAPNASPPQQNGGSDVHGLDNDFSAIKLTNGGGDAKDGISALKFENERLKVALSQSSTNAKKWEQELINLKTNNQRLTAALQESSTNVDEWRKQLSAYKEENSRLKKCLQDSSTADQATAAGGSANQASNLPTTDLLELQSKIESLRTEGKQKDETIRILKARVDELSSMNPNGGAGGGRSGVSKEVADLQKEMAAKVSELAEISRRIGVAVDIP